MRITKYAHACLTVSADDALLLIDPGAFGELPDEALQPGLAAVVLTHDHYDHASPEHLAALRKAHPQVPFFGTAKVAEVVPDAGIHVVQAGDSGTYGPFELTFGGGDHALIHEQIPQAKNVTVQVNDALYHPGDSLVPPSGKVSVLATPISGPWLKTGEAIDYVLASSAEHVIPIHDHLASQTGKELSGKLLGGFAEQVGAAYTALAAGESLDV